MSQPSSIDSVCFTRDGRRLLLRDDHRLSLVQLPDGEERALPGDRSDGSFGELRGFVGFEDEVWVAAGETAPRLHRFSVAGQPVGEPIALPFGGAAARLVAAPYGATSAIWTGEAPCELRFESGGIRVEPIEPGATFLLPVAAQRRLELREGMLQRSEQGAPTPLAAAGTFEGDTLLGGSAILDERAVAMVLERDGGHTLLVVALATGLVQHRLPIGRIRAVRFAPLRGHAMLQLDERKLIVVDLRFGRALKEWEEPSEVVDFAIDPAGRSLVLRRREDDGGTGIFFGSYRDLLGPAAAARGAARPDAAGRTAAAAGAEDAAAATEGDEDGGGAEGSTEQGGGDGEARDGDDTEVRRPEPDPPPSGAVTDEAKRTPAPRVAARGPGLGRRPVPGRGPLAARSPSSAATTPQGAEPTAERFPSGAPARESADARGVEGGPSRPTGLRPPPARPPLPARTPPTPSPAAGRPGLRPPPRTFRASDGGSTIGSTLVDVPAPAATTPSREAGPVRQSAPTATSRQTGPALESAPNATSRDAAPALEATPNVPRRGAGSALETTPTAPSTSSSIVGRRPTLGAGLTGSAPPPARPSTPPVRPATSAPAASPPAARAPATPADSLVEAALALVEALCDRALADGNSEEDAAAADATSRLAAARARLRAVRRGSPLESMAHQLRLSEAAEELLLVAAAPWLRPSLSSRYAELGGTLEGEATLAVAARLLAERAVGELLQELAGTGSLPRLSAVEPLAGPAAALRVHPLLVARLRGENVAAVGRHGPLWIPLATRPVSDLALPEGLAESLAPRFVGSPRLQLRGRTGSGRRSLIASLAAARGHQAGFVDALDAAVPIEEAPEALARGLREALLRGLVPCAVGVDELPPSLQARAAARLAAHPGALLIVAGPTAPPLAGFETFDLGPLAPPLREAAASRALAAHHLPVGAAADLTVLLPAPPGVLYRAVEAAASREWPERDEERERDGDEPDAPAEAVAAVAAAHKRLRAARLEAGVTIESPSAWRPALLDAVTEDALAELRVRAGATLVGEGGGVVALLAGETGSGRRLAAEILAGQLGADLHRVAAHQLGDTPDEAAVRLGRLVEIAEEGGLLLHVTGAGALLAQPSASLLRRLGSQRAVVLLSVEPTFTLSEAARSVASLRVRFPLPDATAREAIWRLHLPREVTGVDCAALARYELNGGAIAAAIDRAAALAAADGVTPAMRHYERAARLSG